MITPLCVLLVEDSEDDALLLVRELRRGGFEPTYRRVDTADAYTQALAAAQWDLIIADYTMPRFSGLAALKLLQEREQDIPFIVVSGLIDESEAVAAMKSGAHDYLMKDNLKRLAPAVARELREAEIRRQRRTAQMALRASEEWMRRANLALLSLARSPNIREGNLPEAFAEITETTAQMLQVERVGIWLFSANQKDVTCYTQYDPEGRCHSHGTLCKVADYPVYFRALAEKLLIVANDILTHPDLVEFAQDYATLGVSSLLDVATRIQNTLAGTITIEHMGRPRTWRPEEEAFASSVADMVSVALSAYERRQVAETLRKSEERYRNLFENANDLIYTLDLTGKITSVNQKIKEITGYAPEEMIGRSVDEVLTPDNRNISNANLARKLAGEAEGTIYELEMIGKQGQTLALEINTRLIDEQGEPSAILGIARDISERKHLEDQLRQAQKMEAIGRLAGVVAHDFNNLLIAILGYSQLILRRLEPHNPFYREINEIEKAGQRAATLTNQLLAFSRRQAAQPQIVNLNHVVTEIGHMLRRIIGEDIELVTVLEPQLGCTKVDPGQIEQVIMNLAVNSRDAMPNGGRLIIETANSEFDEPYASRHPATQSGHYVLLSVSDTGVGMDKETQSRIFEPFFTTKSEGKGTGLGLSTVYGIVKQSNGHIEVQSEPGRGATFQIFLPMVDEKPLYEQLVQMDDDAYGGQETILLAEDDDAVRELVVHLLQVKGYTVLEATDARSALAVCQSYSGPIAAVLTDVVMPQMNGPELVQVLMQLRPTLKVLYMSGYTDGNTVSLNQLSGTLSLLEKPFTAEKLTQRLRQLLDS
jgi:PAS domain S-box-containing protein